MRPFLLVAISAVAVLHPLKAAAQSSFPSTDVISDILKQRVAEKRSAGIVVGLLESDGSTRVVAFGDPGAGQPALDASSVFEIGSITKVFTATMLSQLAAEGKVKLEDPVQKYLPASVHMPTRNGKQITLENLSEQISGLPRLPKNLKPAQPLNPYADYTVTQMYDFLSSYELTRDPGEAFEYSNLGVGLLGHVLSLVTGQSYEAMVRERILTPLGMTHSAITLTPWMREHLAIGHNESGAPTMNWDLLALAGAGALRSTTEDMLRFADANLHPERSALSKAMAMAQQPRRALGGTTSIGLNWFVDAIGGDTIISHNGGTGGYRTFLALNPAKKTAVVVMTNSGGTGADDIGKHLMIPSLPLAPKPATMRQRTAITVASTVLQRYVGTYQLAPAVTMQITLENDALYEQLTGQGRLRIWPETERDFFLREVDAQLTFELGADGSVTGVVLHQGGRDARLPRVK